MLSRTREEEREMMENKDQRLQRVEIFLEWKERDAAKRKGFPRKMKKLGSSWRFFFFSYSLTKLLAIPETS